MLSVALLTLVATGCYRSTGIQRNPLVAEELPETSGDRVTGLKSAAGPGDYFIGNDYIQVAIDGTPFGSPAENVVAGAASGGSIIDVGNVLLDSSYRRVSAPSDVMNRFTPVVNQDPSLELVFTRFTPENLGETSLVVMEGGLRDPNRRIAGAQWDSATGLVKDVSVTHSVALNSQDRFYTLTTTVTNNSGATLGIRNLGDYLEQVGVGYRLAVPAHFDAAGKALSPRWGMEIPGDGTAFANPLAAAVKAPMVGLLDAELGSATMDSHASVGLLPLDAEHFLVTSDPQKVFAETVPQVPARMVVGGLPVASLAPGEHLTHKRRFYVVGGASTDSSTPTAASGLFNLMAKDLYTDVRAQDYGYFQFATSGSAQCQGPMPAEVRIERLVDGAWQLVRVEWLEPTDNVTTSGSFSGSSVLAVLPVGTYRVVARNRDYEYVKETFTNLVPDPDKTNDVSTLYLPQPVRVVKDRLFQASSADLVAPEAAVTTDGKGTTLTELHSVHSFSTHERDSEAGNLQPLRVTFVGTGGTPDPFMRRQRTVGSQYSALVKGPALAASLTPGQYQFRGGNEMFGTGFANAINSTFAWLPNPLVSGATANTYRAYGTRGPLSLLEYKDVSTFLGQSDTVHEFTIWPVALPTGWTSFDMPGPSQATTGGYNPAEMLASAMAEGVQVVGRTEQDRLVDAKGLYDDFRSEFNYAGLTDSVRPASLSDISRTTQLYGADPFVVGARSSVLPGFGEVTALFTPEATGARNGGARMPSQWTLADFLKQAEGQFNVIQRPRGPQGLFQQKGFNRAVTLGQGGNAWWGEGGSYAFGKTNGGFEALELLRGNFDDAGIDAWFAEFKEVRQDWFALLKQQTPDSFTKALGLSSARFSLKTPVGLARTYLKTTPTAQTDLSGVLSALKAGAAVASTGPFLDVSIGAAGPGGLVAGPMATASLKVTLTRSSWMPVDEVRVIVNGAQVPVTLNGVPLTTIHLADLTQSTTDKTQYSATFNVAMPTNGKGAFVVVEAGVSLDQTGAYAVGTPWNQIMRGIYPIAVTNPIFVDVAGGGYKPPML